MPCLISKRNVNLKKMRAALLAKMFKWDNMDLEQ